MRVLYVEHGALVSGGQRSLLELLRGLPADVTAEVACPPAGPLREALAREGVATFGLRGTEGGFKLRPVHTTRLVRDLAGMARAVRVRARDTDADVVHANSTRAGLVCALAFGPRRRGRRPRVVVHVRDTLPPGIVSTTVRAVIRGSADRVIAISAHVADAFGPGARVTVVHNPVDTERFRPDGAAAALPGAGPLLAVVGQITPWKGQSDAIHALAAIRDAGVDARLAIVGEAKFVSAATRFDNRAYERELRELVGELGLEGAVLFTGEREDIPEVLRACSLVLAPSWEEPFGRTIIEAMATALPVLATARGGPVEIITDGVDGRLLEPRRPGLWATTAVALLRDSGARDRLGAAARSTAVKRFGRDRHVEEILALYR